MIGNGNGNGRDKGPSESTLKHLAGMLPSFTKGVIERKATGKGIRVGTPNTVVMPRKACPICGKCFDPFPVEENYIIQMEPCAQHAKDLAEGFTAFTNGNRYVIARSERLKDMAGKIVPLGDAAFEKLAQHYKSEWKTDDQSQGNNSQPT